jgi:hypothetical protein
MLPVGISPWTASVSHASVEQLVVGAIFVQLFQGRSENRQILSSEAF